ncbi:MAG: M14 family metallopeptidase [Vicinamibacterales bacterium]
MPAKNFDRRLRPLILVVLLAVLAPAPAAAQNKPPAIPAGPSGDTDFPISWKQYYSVAEKAKIMQGLQKKYPQLADFGTIGKSRMGRDQHLLTITAKKTGAHDTKPAMWVDGAIHGNEINGVTCALYLAWYLLTRYDYDPYVRDLVDRTTFYILPGLNVDGNDSYALEPNTENNPREPYRPADDDGDGLYDEDQTEDVDGDGEISVMYVEDRAGDLKFSPDKRRFVPVADPREEVVRFRRIGMEGYDNDGDGRINEDDLGGPDPNRNFAYGWSLAAGWPYPMSEVETRNVWEFKLAHPNIFASFHFHNTGRLIMFAAPPDTRGSMTAEQRREQEARVAEQLADLRKADKYAQLFPRIVAPEYQNDMDSQLTIVTEGARILKDYTPTFSGLSGQAQATSYYMLGAYAYLIELWGRSVAEADRNNDGRVDDDEFLAWIDTDLNGQAWISPHKVNHPDLGEVWIGSTSKKHTQRTPPGRYMETEALRNAQFVMYCASQFPRVEIETVSVAPAGADLYWVDVVVRNDRVYPTSSDREVALGTAVKDRMTWTSSPNLSMVDLPEGVVRMPAAGELSAASTLNGKAVEFRLRGRDSLRFRGLVRMEGDTGWIEFKTDSKFGGTATKRVAVKTK